MKESNFCVVAIDETGDWIEDWGIWQHAEKIFGVYLFDSQCATHCCELTPSYELRFIETIVQWKKETRDLDTGTFDDIREKWMSEIDEVDCERPLVIYVHCRQIDCLKDKTFTDTGSPRLVSIEKLQYKDDEETYEELFNEYFEYARCNSVM